MRWLRRPGDRVSEGEPLLEVETDKATMDVEAYVAGYLREIFITEGETVSAMAPIAVLTDDPDESYLKSSTSLSEIPTTRPPSPSESSFEKTDYMRVQAVPAARSLAREHGIDLGSVVGTGPKGLITKNDVERFIASSQHETGLGSP